MAQLILTDEEKATAAWLDCSDESVGVVTKYMMTCLNNAAGRLKEERGKIEFASITQLLIGLCASSNAETTTVAVNGYTYKGEELGDWKITIERTRKP